MRSLVIGASAGLGRALAEELASKGHDLFLVSSDIADLKPLMADLVHRFDVSVYVMAADLKSSNPEDIRQQVVQDLSGADNVFLVAGISSPEQDSGKVALDLLDRIIQTNFVAGIRIVNCFIDDLAENPKGHFIGIGSVAAARARRTNSVYSASKRGLEFYFESLRHYMAGHPCRVQFYRLGYLLTRMTLGQKLLLPAMTPEAAARSIVARMNHGEGVRYLPWWWQPVMILYQLIPWPIYKRMTL